MGANRETVPGAVEPVSRLLQEARRELRLLDSSSSLYPVLNDSANALRRAHALTMAGLPASAAPALRAPLDDRAILRPDPVADRRDPVGADGSSVPSGLTVNTFPSPDRAFRVHVQSAVQALEACRPETLQAELRHAYPRAEVHVACELATVTRRPRWYVYRDGRLLEPAAPADWGWADDLPRTILGADGVYLDANAAAADLFGVDRDAIVGAPAGSFTRHEGDPDVARRLFETLSKVGELTSTAVVARPDGSLIPIDFHTSVDDPSGQYRTVMRRRATTEEPPRDVVTAGVSHQDVGSGRATTAPHADERDDAHGGRNDQRRDHRAEARGRDHGRLAAC